MDIISSQTLSPKIVDLNSLIHGMTGLLSRTLGETISIRAVASAELKMVEIDPGQVETALLAPNAETSLYPWKDAPQRTRLAIRHIQTFLRANCPAG